VSAWVKPGLRENKVSNFSGSQCILTLDGKKAVFCTYCTYQQQHKELIFVLHHILKLLVQ
jgi:hypothetical protein